jgi:tetrahydroxynaphthalene reductase
MPGLTTSTGKYSQIPGPLGLAAASLEGKVALVTGAGMSTNTVSFEQHRPY